jgi:hypothetical protein
MTIIFKVASFVWLVKASVNITPVARARRRGDRPPTKNKCKFNVMGGYIWSMWGDKEFVVS